MTKVLFVVSGADHWTLSDGTSHPTGFWAEELVEPHRVFSAAGYELSVATPGGVTPTVDRSSLAPAANGGPERAQAIASYLDSLAGWLERPLVLAEVEPVDYDLVFYPGGHGPMEDLSADSDSGRLVTEVLDSGRPLAVLCHAPAALLAARRPNGAWPFAGYRLTGFTDAEESAAGLAAKAPWLLQERLVELGAEFQQGPPFAPNVVVERNLFTGQNPASSGPLAELLVQRLSERD